MQVEPAVAFDELLGGLLWRTTCEEYISSCCRSQLLLPWLAPTPGPAEEVGTAEVAVAASTEVVEASTAGVAEASTEAEDTVGVDTVAATVVEVIEAVTVGVDTVAATVATEVIEVVMAAGDMDADGAGVGSASV